MHLVHFRDDECFFTGKIVCTLRQILFRNPKTMFIVRLSSHGYNSRNVARLEVVGLILGNLNQTTLCFV